MKKGVVCIKKDISVLCKILIEDGVFIQTPGRVGWKELKEWWNIESIKRRVTHLTPISSGEETVTSELLKGS